ncbi:MAG: 60S ribosomal export protein NMD3 [Thermoplasmata archaeon]
MNAEFCVVCGRSDRPVEDGMCLECFANRTRLVEVATHPSVTICPTCGARKVGQHWEGEGRTTLLSPEDLLPFLRPHADVGIRRVHWEEGGGSPWEREITARADVRLRGEERTLELQFPVHVEPLTCPECSRRAGHFYTALIQLRGLEDGPREPPRELRTRLASAWDGTIAEARSEWRRALSFREERPEGWDLFLSDTIAARALARWMKVRLKAELKESATLWGRKDGRDVYRVTLCLRVPPANAPEPRAHASRSPTARHR